MRLWKRKSVLQRLFALFLVAVATLVMAATTTASPAPDGPASPAAQQKQSPTRLRGNLPARAIAAATRKERLDPNTTLSLTFTLPLRDREGLAKFLSRVYDPADPLYGHYLTPKEFADNYGPTQADYDALAAYANGVGLTVTNVHSNRTLLNVSGPAGRVEAAFKLALHRYQATNGREFYAPDNEPELPAEIAGRITGVLGLDNAALLHSHAKSIPASGALNSSPRQLGSGPGGALTPAELLKAYNLDTVPATGAGQTLALFELASYDPTDVAAYVASYGLTSVPLVNVLVDNGPFPTRCSSPDPDSLEVALDIELMMAVAPGASKIIVYQGPNTVQGVIDTYNKIATDNLASQVSTSWGIAEEFTTQSWTNAENQTFQQMAAQGQTLYAASGDNGAYDDAPHTSTPQLSVDDPASQPLVVAAGGTTLSLNADKTYLAETSWIDPVDGWQGGGGGVSRTWSIPSWQQGVPNAASTTMRNVPDVALNSDVYSGYSAFWAGQWVIVGGTSCASPIWAAFTARVNDRRVATGNPVLGFVTPRIYQIANGPNYGADFHDVADGSNNFYYLAVAGYDNATGWGSLNGANLFADLTVDPAPSAGPLAPPTNLTAQAVNGAAKLSWKASYLATSYNVYRGTGAGAEDATPIASGITATTYTDIIPNGVTYYYRVAAVNVSGTSGYSNEVAAAPVAMTLPATPANVVLSWVNGAMSLTWSASSGATGYNVYRATTSGGETNTPASGPVGITSTSYTDPVPSGAKYYYQVEAVNAAGPSPRSGEVTLPEVMYPPSQAAIHLVDTLKGIIEFGWSVGGIFPANGDINYNPAFFVVLEESLNGGPFTPIYSGTGTGYTRQVPQSGTYSYRIKSSLAGYTDSPYVYLTDVTGSDKFVAKLTCVAPNFLNIRYNYSYGSLSPQWGTGGSPNLPGPPPTTYLLQISIDGLNWTTVYAGTNPWADVWFPSSGTYTLRVKATRPGSGWLDSDWTYGSQQCAVSLPSNSYMITSLQGSGGYVYPHSGTVSQGSSASYEIAACGGYVIAGVTVDGVAMGPITSYTFSNVQASHTISATYATGPSNTITATAGTGGTVYPPAVAVGQGSSQSVAIIPNEGFVIAGVTVDGVPQGPITSYLFSNVTANHTVAATFAPAPNYTITAIVGPGGTLSAGTVTVAPGGSQTYTFTPNSGFVVAGVRIDGVFIGRPSSYTFIDVNANHSIAVTFEISTWYTVTASAGSGGTVSPGTGTIYLAQGSNETFTIAPNPGYVIAGVTVDGTPLGAISSYQFTNVTANHTIAATFSSGTVYTITATAGSGGSITPGTMTIGQGGTQTFTITPNTGYVIAAVLVDNVSQGPISSYTFNNVTANHTITASFAAVATYTITATGSGSGGTVTPASAIVNQGGSQTIIITPSPGWVVGDVKVDGVSVGVVYSYTFSNVTANHTLSVTFYPTITATAGPNGSITPSGTVVVTGGSQSFTISPASGYQVANVVVDGTPQGPVTSYTFGTVLAPHTIAATFVTILPDLVVTSINPPASAATGQSISVPVSVKNQGGSSTASFTVGVYLCPSSAISTSCTAIGSQSVSSLAAGAVQSLTISATIPAVSGGSYYIGAIADTSNSVSEAVETNNALAAGATTVTIPPTTTSNFNPAAGAVFKASQPVTLTATDHSGTGIKSTYYKIDNGSFTQGNSFTITGDGLHTFSYYSTDNANGTETTHVSNSFRIDTIAPSTSCDAVNGQSYTGSQTFNLSASDPGGSGVAATYYKLDNGAWTSGTSVAVPSPASGSVTHTISWYSTDVATNQEAAKSVTFTVSPAITGVAITFIANTFLPGWTYVQWEVHDADGNVVTDVNGNDCVWWNDDPGHPADMTHTFVVPAGVGYTLYGGEGPMPDGPDDVSATSTVTPEQAVQGTTIVRYFF